MNVKDYLDHLRVLDLMIRMQEDEIEELNESMMSAPALRYDKVNVQTSPRNALEEKEAIKDKKVSDLKKKKREYESFRNTIIRQIMNLADGKQSEVLMRTYVYRQRIYRIASEMNYSIESVKRIKREALQEFDKKYEIYKVDTF